mmetsp:Transcript_5484/g.7947  ORF Transcript_5484/g.7947 Transcript_5484/m.7947 type:complete len:758 (+) Transcript_5484:371-2644(+)|eukprot:CAMPEP_0194207946 /NCGR_PEP_ID=MMETSP0156-20130528/6551_1 /TAXON_ID=33649 /ORGANISM="Thalassionema nitzschioides, Strain L26-B" /LENGTH=757 /DNA_ID=CAMNT_0038934823 /DNA_START=296 /DNA_END=2572 /DNA_ORIENTATION=+
MRQTTTTAAAAVCIRTYLLASSTLLLFGAALLLPTGNAFILPTTATTTSQKIVSKLFVSQMDKTSAESQQEKEEDQQIPKIPKSLRTGGRGMLGRNSPTQMVDSASYESQLLNSWDTNIEKQTGFDWEIEKMRRYFAGLRLREDGSWVKKPSLLDFLVTKGRASSMELSQENTTNGKMNPKPVNTVDVLTLVATNVLAGMGFDKELGMARVPTAVIQKYEGSMLSFIKGVLGGDLQTLAGGPLFLLLAKYYHDYGPIFNLSFGPKSFLVVSDPVMARHILRESSPDQYCKGMLAEILEPIMGKGLIPADPATWKVRRRAIVPGFHKRWLKRMNTLFADSAEILVNDLKTNNNAVDMEERFCSVTLDIIGKAVFNYDFGSVTSESPIVKAVYRVLREAEHRSSSFIPYWNLPYADQWMGGQVEFREDMTMLDDILCELINNAISTRKEASVEDLEKRDNAEDPSLLRFLVDMRDEDLSSSVLRDDLMTMLIAGHETTAAMLTWTLFELSRGDPELLQEVQAEVRTVLRGKKRPDYDDIEKFPKLGYCLIEALRLYPEPPVLIRRARTEDQLPGGGAGLGDRIKVLRGTDFFVSTWNLHRSPELWEDPERFDPTRWERKFINKSVTGWAGFDPDKMTGLYPNEIATDFAFLPFGGGKRKCVGDQFAMMEAIVTMSMMLNEFDFEFVGSPDDVGMKTGATIHTMNGLNMKVIPANNNNIPKANGWWEQQHLQRGLGPNGRPVTEVNLNDSEEVSRDPFLP